jgi:hypothetical protein
MQIPTFPIFLSLGTRITYISQNTTIIRWLTNLKKRSNLDSLYFLFFWYEFPRHGRLNDMFGANEMSFCKQDLILQEERNCETSISIREAASQQSLSGGQVFFKCSCKSKFSSNRCKCKKNGVLCNSRRHSS